jgi:hypothetical protein
VLPELMQTGPKKKKKKKGVTCRQITVYKAAGIYNIPKL